MTEARVEPEAAAVGTEAEPNRRAARRFVQATNERRLDEWDDLFAKGFATHMPGLAPEADRAALRSHVEMLLAAFPDLRYDIEAEVAQGDEVVYRLRGTGTHRGELFGMAGSGGTARWEEMHVLRFEADGGLVEHWGLIDVASMMMQLGLMPPVERW